MDNNSNDNQRPPPRVLNIPMRVWDNILRFTYDRETLLALMQIGHLGVRDAAVHRYWMYYAEITAENIQAAAEYAPIIRSLTIRDFRVLDSLAHMEFQQLIFLRLENVDQFPVVMNLGRNIEFLQLVGWKSIDFDNIRPWLADRVFTSTLQVVQMADIGHPLYSHIDFIRKHSPQALILHDYFNL
ncbi:hypothetical protein BJV82DRAFT_668122 [Fennellomyces sp. T-0311]|nr:hypothetical protein BJV82DRAFT_668122 [Fennellomyces sp. T-0311]